MQTSELNEKWNAICDKVASYPEVVQSQFNALLTRIQPQAISDGFLLLTTENSFMKTWAEKNFSGVILRACEDLYQMPFNVLIEIDESPSQAVTPSATPAQTTPMPQPQPAASSMDSRFQIPDFVEETVIKEVSNTPEAPDSRASNPLLSPDPSLSSFTFENFVIGESNRMAYSMAVQVAEFPGNTPLNPLFIYGRSGLGKTHLMRAIQDYINRTRPDLVTIYVDSEELISEYTDAVAQHDREKSSYKNFKAHYETADVLLVDDIQYLQGKTQTLDIVFQIFNKLISQGKQIILSADRAPKNIDIEERYSSRFMQGGTVDIQPPEVETKMAIVKSYINEYRSMQGNESLYIPEEIQEYIAENSGSNIRELKGAVTIVIYHMNLPEHPPISINEVSNLLEDHFMGMMSKNLTIEDIQKQVESYYKVKHADLIGSSRAREVVFPRQIAMYLCRQLLDVPYETIGMKFNKDHSTVMYTVGKIENMLLENRNVQEEVEVLKKLIKEL
ncbi:MAG: chromosomal replication initiator protein DnaA [Eggerthellaceae bacterium]|nr:chromosomal replication initiator protein DnaA [Eggerthellaceae bacterium]